MQDVSRAAVREELRLPLEQMAGQWPFVDTLLEQLDVCICGIDLKDHKVIFVNGRAHCFMALEVGDTCHQAVRGLDAPCSECPLSLLESGQETIIKGLHYTENGWSETLASLITEQDGRRIGLISSFNVSHYHIDRAQLDLVSKNIPGGMLGFYLEEGLPFYFVNEPMLAYLGYANEAAFREATGGFWTQVVSTEERETQLALMLSQLEAGGEYELLSCKLKKMCIRDSSGSG